MFIRPCYKKSNGKKLAYWALVETYRTAKGPRQRVVAYLGKLQKATRQGIKQAAEGKGKPKFVQAQLFNEDALEPEWVEINANDVRVENKKAFGGPCLALELVKLLALDDSFTARRRACSLVACLAHSCHLPTPPSFSRVLPFVYYISMMFEIVVPFLFCEQMS